MYSLCIFSCLLSRLREVSLIRVAAWERRSLFRFRQLVFVRFLIFSNSAEIIQPFSDRTSSSGAVPTLSWQVWTLLCLHSSANPWATEASKAASVPHTTVPRPSVPSLIGSPCGERLAHANTSTGRCCVGADSRAYLTCSGLFSAENALMMLMRFPIR